MKYNSNIALASIAIWAIVNLNPAWAGERKGEDSAPSITIEKQSPAFLGISSRSSRGLPGAQVTSIVAESAAVSADLAVGDTIGEFDGQEIRTSADLIRAVDSLEGGDRVSLMVRRDGETIQLGATLGTRTLRHKFTATGEWHVWARNFRAHVKDGTVLAGGVDDLILSIANDPIVEAGDIRRSLQDMAGQSIDLDVIRDGGLIQLRVDLAGEPADYPVWR